MLISKKISVILFGILGLFLVAQFQNCATPHDQEETSNLSETTSSSSGVVTGIDNVNIDTKLQFIDSNIAMYFDSSTVIANGLCASTQVGARLRWQLSDAEGNSVMVGFVPCTSEGFQVVINDVQGLACGENYTLVARLGLGEEGSLILNRKCPATKVLPISDDNYVSNKCFVEFSQEENICEKSCYSSEGYLITSEVVDNSVCSSF